MRTKIAEGLRYVLRHPYLKNIAASTATFNFFGSLWSAVLIVYAVRVLGLGPGLVGLAFTLGNSGALIAAFFAGRISARLGVGPTIIAAASIGGPMFLIAAFAPHGNAALAILGPALLVGSFANVLYNVTQLSLRQTITPERIQGRMNSVMRFIVWGTIPAGALLGGALGTWIGLKETLIVGGIGCCLAFLPVLFSQVRDLREMPAPADDLEYVLDPLLADAAAAATYERPRV
jgi:MFS family permease